MSDSTNSVALRRATGTFPDPLTAQPIPAGALDQVIVGEERCPPGALYESGAFDALMLFLTHEGRTDVQVGGGVLTHQPGTLLTIASGQEITERVGDAPWRFSYVFLYGPWAEIFGAWMRPHTPAASLAAATARQQHLMNACIGIVHDQQDGWQWACLACCCELLGSLCRTPPNDSLLARLETLMDEAPLARPSPDQLAARLGVTPRQLLYQVQKAAGEPLALWMRRRRVASARRLLSQGLSVSEVAERLGFADPYHFSRVYKSITGAPPSSVLAALKAGRLHDVQK